jgi:glycosyltransferase involved in cell wall biosynthesis
LAQTFHDQFDDVEVTLFHCEDRLCEPPFHGLRRPFSRLLNAFLARLGGSTLVYDMGVAEEIIARTREADILHLHNLHGYYLDYCKLLHAWKDRPVVWTLHDMWSLTGRCGFSFECDRWHNECHVCPHKHYYPKAWFDHARKEFKIKSYLYSCMSSLTIVSPSEWLSGLAMQRGFSRKKVHLVPNPVDTTKFRPVDKHAARNELNLPHDAFIALFVAADCGDPRKGYSDFAHAIRQAGCFGIAIGKQPPKPAEDILHTGSISDRSIINLYYCAADVFINPTYADNYPNTVLEALVNGTPVVGYDEGGIASQLITPYCALIDKGDIRRLRIHIERLIQNNGMNHKISNELSRKALNQWAPKTIANKYTTIYNKSTGLIDN